MISCSFPGDQDDVITLDHTGVLKEIPILNIVAPKNDGVTSCDGIDGDGGGGGDVGDHIGNVKNDSTVNNQGETSVENTNGSSQRELLLSEPPDYVLKLPTKIYHDEPLSPDILQEYFVAKIDAAPTHRQRTVSYTASVSV